MTLPAGIVLLTPWVASALLWRRGWFGLARAAAAVGTLVLAFVAAYYWQAYDINWAMAVPFVVGMVAVSACGIARGEKASAVSNAFVLVGIPIFFMLLTFNYFTKMFLLIRADASVREVVHFKGALRDLPPASRGDAVAGFIRALSSDDLFLKWGAVHQLWISGLVAAPAAEAVARAVVSTRDMAPSAPREYLRRDGVRFLGSFGPEGGPALLLILREGDESLHYDALDSITRIGPPMKDSALPELVRLSVVAKPESIYWIQRTREALGVSEGEWRLAGGASR
ncbi:MAG: hypothetical protein A2V88_13805 [Elusimicrobia bacterium RBG_16_66_12]|nr:MAG: hypothetical protein A2V88_13805 [Elusimicrobia bacterium RBG_16_66_12]